jgi:hypothetical protein
LLAKNNFHLFWLKTESPRTTLNWL